MNQQLITEIRENKSVNRTHSLLLILGMLALLSLVGYLTFGWVGFVISVLLTGISCLLGQRISTAWIMKMYKASEIRPEQAPGLYQAFVELAKRADLEHSPKLYYIPSRMPNAFATGHNATSAVAVTDGILRMMNPREMNGILAHELAHLMHRDTKVLALADTMSRIASTASRIGFFLMLFSGFFAILSDGVSVGYVVAFLILFVTPTMMVLLQLALSRSREFNADLGAVQLTGDALGLASALNKLERLNKRNGFWQRIFQPGQKRSQPAFLRTHPPTDERVKLLLEHVDESTLKEIRNQQNARQVIAARSHDQPRKIVVQVPRVRTRPKYRISSGMWR